MLSWPTAAISNDHPSGIRNLILALSLMSLAVRPDQPGLPARKSSQTKTTHQARTIPSRAEILHQLQFGKHSIWSLQNNKTKQHSKDTTRGSKSSSSSVHRDIIDQRLNYPRKPPLVSPPTPQGPQSSSGIQPANHQPLFIPSIHLVH